MVDVYICASTRCIIFESIGYLWLCAAMTIKALHAAVFRA